MLARLARPERAGEEQRVVLEPLQVDGPGRGTAVLADGDEGDRAGLRQARLARLLDPLAEQRERLGSASAIAVKKSQSRLEPAPRLRRDVARRLLRLAVGRRLQRLHGAAALQPPDRPAALGRRHRPYYESMAAVGEVADGATIVDCPCGAGPALRALEPGRDVRYVAADLSPAMLGRARRAGRAARPSIGSSSSRRRPKTCRSRTASADLFLSYWGLHCYPDPRGGDRRDRARAQARRPPGRRRPSCAARACGSV